MVPCRARQQGAGAGANWLPPVRACCRRHSHAPPSCRPSLTWRRCTLRRSSCWRSGRAASPPYKGIHLYGRERGAWLAEAVPCTRASCTKRTSKHTTTHALHPRINKGATRRLRPSRTPFSSSRSSSAPSPQRRPASSATSPSSRRARAGGAGLLRCCPCACSPLSLRVLVGMQSSHISRAANACTRCCSPPPGCQ